MPFKSKAQRRLFYVLKEQGKLSQKTLDEWEKDTPKNIPERIKKAYINEELKKLSLNELIKVGQMSKMEKEAFMGKLLAGAGKSLLRGGKYIGEAATNIAIGGRGGLKARQVIEPLTKFKGTKPLSTISKWDPFHGVKQMGKLRQVIKEGPLKGAYRYAPGKGAEEYLYQSLPKSTRANILQRTKNMPKFMLQELRGGTPTPADQLIRSWAGKANLSPGEFMKRHGKEVLPELEKAQQSFKYFAKNYPGQAAKLYGKKGLWQGMLVGLPAYDVSTILAGKGDPEKSMPENLGRALGSGAGFLGFSPLGFVAGLGAMEGSAYLGELAGKGISNLVPKTKKLTPDQQFNNFIQAQRDLRGALPDTSAQLKRRAWEEGTGAVFGHKNK